MKARCIHCGWHWGVSIIQEIPVLGYECPICATKIKRAPRDGSPNRAQNKIILSA